MRAGARGDGYLAWVLAVPLAGTLAGPAAADVNITSSVTVETTLTDNDDFEPDGESDAIVSVRPAISLTQLGGRSRTSLDYSLNTEYSARDSELDVIHDLDGFNNTEIVRNFFFVDVGAGISQRVIDNRLGTPARRGDDSNNLTPVQRYSISPYIVNRWGSFATSQLRARAGYVDSGEDELDDETEYSVSGFLASGPDFSRFSWNLNGRYEIEDRGGNDERTTQNIRLDTQTAIDRSISLIAGVGYEKIDDEEFSDKIEGITWEAGFDWHPGEKLSLVATYGKRFDEDNLFVDFDYDVTARTTVFLNYSETVTTEQALLLNDLSFIGFDEEGNLIDTRTGLPLDDDGSLFSLTDRAFRREVFDAGVRITRPRDRFSLTASHETRDFESGLDDETILGAEFDWSHDLSRSMQSSLGLSYDRIDFGGDDAGRKDDLYTFRATLSEEFAQSVSGSVSYLFRTRDSNRSSEDATENAVVVGVTKVF